MRHREPRARVSGARRGTWLTERGFAGLLTPVLTFFLLRSLSGEDPVRVLGDSEVGVRIDRWSGRTTVLDAPGAHPRIPFLQDIQVLDRRPVEYVMKGTARVDGNHTPKLVVRSRDGANYEFAEVVVQYTIDVARADEVLIDSGVGEAYKSALLDVFARPVLREEFGRFTTNEVLRPSARLTATVAAKAALQEHLAPHGIVVLEVSVSKPTFTKEFETVFNRRLVADQDIEATRRKISELEAGHPERMAQVARIKDHETEIVRAAAERALEQARLEEIRGRSEADRQARTRTALAELERDEKLARAARLTERYRLEAEEFRGRVEDLAQRGRGAVRAALVGRLDTIRFELEPRELWSKEERERQASARLETDPASPAVSASHEGGI